MRIGLDARMYRSDTGGIGTFSQQLIKNIGKLDQRNEYLVFLTKKDIKEYKSPGKNFKSIVVDIPHYSLKEQLVFPNILRKYNLDLIHFFHFAHPVLYKGKYIVSVHDLTMNKQPVGGQRNPIKNLAYNFVIKNAIKKSALISVLTNTIKQEIIDQYQVDPEKINVVPLAADNRFEPVDPDIVSPILVKYRIDSPYILFVSQWRPHKGAQYLIKALPILRKTFNQKGLKLVITGKPTDKFPKLANLIEQAKIKDLVCLPGFVDSEDLPAIYSGAKAFVFPSLMEGFGLPPLEAMACNTPVASSNLSCMPEVLENAALYFDPKDPADIALKVNTLLTNQKLADKLKERGLQQTRKYSWQKTAQKTLRLYKQVLNVK